MTIRILESAKVDLIEGYRFYERQSREVGAYFLDSPFADIGSLSLYTGIHRRVYGLHRALSKRFPFAIYYEVVGEEVQIHSILDCRRRPSWIRRRLRRIP